MVLAKVSVLQLALKNFNGAIAEAKKNKMKHFLQYGAPYVNYYKQLVKKQLTDKNVLLDDVFLLEKIQQHLLLIKNLIELNAAMNDPANDLRVDTKNILVKSRSLFHNADAKHLTNARTKAKEFIPLVKKLFEQACLAQLHNLNRSATDLESLTFLTETLKYVTVLVKDKTKSSTSIEDVLYRSRMVIMSKKKKMFMSNPRLINFCGLLIMAASIAMIIAGALACAAPGGVVFGIPLIVAGTGLFLVGKKIKNSVSPSGTEFKAHNKRSLFESNLGETLKKIAHTKATVNAYKDADKTLRKVQPLFNDVASEELYLSKSLR